MGKGHEGTNKWGRWSTSRYASSRSLDRSVVTRHLTARLPPGIWNVSESGGILFEPCPVRVSWHERDSADVHDGLRSSGASMDGHGWTAIMPLLGTNGWVAVSPAQTDPGFSKRTRERIEPCVPPTAVHAMTCGRGETRVYSVGVFRTGRP